MAKTLRELVAMIEKDDPRYLDAPLNFQIWGNGKRVWAVGPSSLWDCPRTSSEVSGGASLGICVTIPETSDYRLTRRPKERKAVQS